MIQYRRCLRAQHSTAQGFAAPGKRRVCEVDAGRQPQLMHFSTFNKESSERRSGSSKKGGGGGVAAREMGEEEGGVSGLMQSRDGLQKNVGRCCEEKDESNCGSHCS